MSESMDFARQVIELGEGRAEWKQPGYAWGDIIYLAKELLRYGKALEEIRDWPILGYGNEDAHDMSEVANQALSQLSYGPQEKDR